MEGGRLSWPELVASCSIWRRGIRLARLSMRGQGERRGRRDLKRREKGEREEREEYEKNGMEGQTYTALLAAK